jgi:hypothetical protein
MRLLASFLFGLFVIGLSLPALAADPCTSGRFECDPRVLEAAADSWRDAGFGFLEEEAGFCAIRKALPEGGCTIEIERLPTTGERRQISFTLNPYCVGIFHTHPHSTDPKPSTGDRKVADRVKRLMFTISQKGIYRYDPFQKTLEHVRKDTKFQQACAPRIDTPR